SCRSAKHLRKAVPHHPRLPRADPDTGGKAFSQKSSLPYIARVLKSPERLESSQASSGTITCDLALEAMRKQPGGKPGKANT
ncbi:hypothetical protein PANDA_014669, partial [Ailuropoda melanoleuca]